MSKNPRDEDDRDVAAALTISESDEWWTGVVRDRDPHTGTRRIRLERRTLDASRGWTTVHSWRVHPDYWDAERKAVGRFERGAGRSDPPALPVDQSIDVTRYLRVRRDGSRWVAVVKFEDDWGRTRTRLYHWDADGRKRQSWTVGRNWTGCRDAATRQLSRVA